MELEALDRRLHGLGCSWGEAVAYLENNSRGLKIGPGVHIDHIKPYAAFSNLNSPIQQRLVNNWRNLQLLTAEENLSKGLSHDHATWSISEAGIKLLAFECELRAAAVDNDAVVTYVDESSDESSDEYNEGGEEEDSDEE
jgi:hypothetical protein